MGQGDGDVYARTVIHAPFCAEQISIVWCDVGVVFEWRTTQGTQKMRTKSDLVNYVAIRRTGICGVIPWIAWI